MCVKDSGVRVDKQISVSGPIKNLLFPEWSIRIHTRNDNAATCIELDRIEERNSTLLVFLSRGLEEVIHELSFLSSLIWTILHASEIASSLLWGTWRFSRGSQGPPRRHLQGPMECAKCAYLVGNSLQATRFFLHVLSGRIVGQSDTVKMNPPIVLSRNKGMDKTEWVIT